VRWSLTFLDYGSIEAKNEGYGSGKGGNGLILHKRFSHRTSKGQPWSVVAKLWNRAKTETTKTRNPYKKKNDLQQHCRAKPPRGAKESSRWVKRSPCRNIVSKAQVILSTEKVISQSFDKVRQLQHTGVIVRAAHNRSLDSESERLWSKLEGQPISLEQEIELPQTSKRSARKQSLLYDFAL